MDLQTETQVGTVPGVVYTCSPQDLAYVPSEVQREMFDSGRLRCARYDGGNKWHVFTDEEMRLFEFNRMKGEEPVLVEAPPTDLPKLDLGCGLNPKEGFEGVDLCSEKAQHKIDLCKFPWPWADESIEEIYTSHFLEHIPARDIEERDLSNSNDAQFVGQDMLFAIMDECWRILRPGGKLFIIVPNVRSDGGFQDPTHRRFFNQNTFQYFSIKGRAQLDVSHYQVRCNFERTQITPAGLIEVSLMHPLVQHRRFNESWNTIFEWQVTLKKQPLT